MIKKWIALSAIAATSVYAANNMDNLNKPIEQTPSKTIQVSDSSLPPGLEKKDMTEQMPPGLEKKGKTPPGWQKGKKRGWHKHKHHHHHGKKGKKPF